MGISFHWRSETGLRTGDNRDCGGVGIRHDGALCIVLDGSTARPNSGELARYVARELIDWFVASNDEVMPDVTVAKLRQIHGSLPQHCRRGSASYMIVHLQGTGAIVALHAGDCLLGRLEETGDIKWLTRPHTLADFSGSMPVETIAGVPLRHRLTRSLRAREFMSPDVVEIQPGEEFVMATDGFWAELSPNQQLRFLQGADIPMAADGDDRSILRLRRLDGATKTAAGPVQDNLYVKVRS